MEVEAKFSVADRATWERLLAADSFGRYKAARGPIRDIEDVYVDTAGWALYRQGYACRLRRAGGAWSVWLKGRGGAEGAIHRREELSQNLPGRGQGVPALTPAGWPEGALRERLLDLLPNEESVASGELRSLFTLCQTRHLRTLFDGSRAVAELSLDEVSIHQAGPVDSYLELEAELLPSAVPGDIEELAAVFGGQWSLQPQPLSKHKRALQVLGLTPPPPVAADGGAPGETLAQPPSSSAPGEWEGAGAEKVRLEHRRVLEAVLRLGRPLHQRRARLLLTWDQGADIQALQECCGYSRSSVYFWLNAYARDGLGVFPATLVRHASGGVEQTVTKTPSPPPGGAEAETRIPPQGDAEDELSIHTGSSADGEGETPAPAEDETQAPGPAAFGRGQDVGDEGGSISLRALMRRYDVDPDHGRHVADLALRLFDISAPVHRLGDASRALLEKAALLHNLGLASDPDRHHVAGRDILLGHRVDELTDEERAIVAACIWLHRKAIRPPKLERRPVTDVPDARRGEMLMLAALIRLADGLDYSGTQDTHIVGDRQSGDTLSVTVEGPEAELDAARADEKSDLWDLLREDVRWEFTTTGIPAFDTSGSGEQPDADDDPLATDFESLLAAGVEEPRAGDLASLLAAAADKSRAPEPASRWEPDDPRAHLLAEPEIEGALFAPEQPAAEAARAVMRFHLARMLRQEPGARLGEDIEAVHDMRVAVRRMRSAYRLFDEFFEGKQWRKLRGGLRQTAAALGAVRDLDVLLEHAELYAADRAATGGAGIEPLLEAWRGHRENARQAMIDWLDGREYARFSRDLAEFVSAPGVGARVIDAETPWPARVADTAPRLIYTALGRVRAYEPFLIAPPLATLHALRIDCKRYRYTLEFFKPLLGDDAREVIESTVAVQDHLGRLHDADVAEQLVRDFLDGGASGPDALSGASSGSRRRECGRRIIAPGVVQYLAARQVELQALLDTFRDVWSRLTGADARRSLALAVANL